MTWVIQYKKSRRRISFVLFSFCCGFLSGCSEHPSPVSHTTALSLKDTIVIQHKDGLSKASLPEQKTDLEKQLIQMGLVDVQPLIADIKVDMRYSTTHNFLAKDVYGDFDKCYLQPDVADKLKNAQLFLKNKYPFYSLIVFDAARPLSIQQKMWDTLTLSVSKKVKYLSNPKRGSLHNFGAALDVSIVNEKGVELDMGTPFDYFGELAYPVKETELLADGKLTQEQVNNRKLLREVMYKAGFFNIQTEWWHFNSCYRKEAVEKYKRIDF